MVVIVSRFTISANMTCWAFCMYKDCEQYQQAFSKYLSATGFNSKAPLKLSYKEWVGVVKKLDLAASVLYSNTNIMNKDDESLFQEVIKASLQNTLNTYQRHADCKYNDAQLFKTFQLL